ncbi:MAG: hypothetical protein M3033_11085 [Acidobacteriota bacterium]|nr:hypothetical protein [Acidobacteriota bacterium]
MTTENQTDDKRQTEKDANNKPQDDAENKTTVESSGDPGRTPGSAEGDEETIDADIREKEAEGKL